MEQRLRYLALIALVTLAGATGQRCKFSVPFNSSLVSRSFFAFSECFRPCSESSIRIFRKRFVYTPPFFLRIVPRNCEERFEFHIRRGTPFVIRFPEVGPDEIPKGKQPEIVCKKLRKKKRERFNPKGKTRRKFIRTVRKLVKGIAEIRDFGCMNDEDGFPIRVKGRGFTNVDVEGIVTYLLGVAFQFNFCAQ